jgi:tRNA (cytidine/uridine-2'-O-)-methyltransferase
MDDRKLRRAGLDYREWASVSVHASLQAFCAAVEPSRLWAVSTRGTRCYSEVHYQAGDALLFGPETRGLPPELLQQLGSTQIVRLPMVAESRSLNLSNAVAVLVYEAWRQQGFPGGA